MCRYWKVRVRLVLVGALVLLLAGGAFAASDQFCKDLDLDGFGDSTDCEKQWESGLVGNSDDCDDSDFFINPAALEVCGDGIDNNCANGIDEGAVCGSSGNKAYYYQDLDGDTFGNPLVWEFTSNPSPGFVADGSDCEDTNVGINPMAPEVCEYTTDENCNGVIDEGCVVWMEDADGDGYSSGDSSYSIQAPAGYVDAATLISTTEFDCVTDDGSINPAATELWGDQVDQNCDGDPGPYFPDAILADCILSNTHGNYDSSSVVALKYLACGGIGVTDLSGLENLQNLTYLNIENSDIVDLAPISNLTNLSGLILNNNNLSDIQAITGLTNLDHLRISNNSITDITPVSGMTKMRIFHCYGGNNRVVDISPLAGMVDLEELYMDRNQISDLTPLAGLVNLKRLLLESNLITDIQPLANLVNLTRLRLNGNRVEDLSPLSSMSNLDTLEYRSGGLTNLNFLEGMENLRTVYVNNNELSDLTPLSTLQNLSGLWFEHNSVSDLTPLSGLQKLSQLRMSYNKVSDLSPLSSINSLSTIIMYNNLVTNLTPLTGLTNLYSIYLGYNYITDFSPVSHVQYVIGAENQYPLP